jgi:hypothetical protein
MIRKFDIFRLENEAKVRWLEVAASLQDAKNRLQQLAVNAPGSYIIWDSDTGEKHFINLLGVAASSESKAGKGQHTSNLQVGGRDAFQSSQMPDVYRQERNIEYMQYPAWQSLCWDAVREFDRSKLPERVANAERAVLQRARELSASKGDDDERVAISDALESLAFLKRLLLPRE